MTNNFDSLGLSDKVITAVTAAGYTVPTQIQADAIPHVLQRKDVIGIAQTGTGKTASFVLPMLTLLEKGRARARMPRTLILEPTRELASQVHENFEKYGINHKLNVALLIGGVSFVEQNRILDRGADVLIATPGRLLDHFERGRLLMTGVDVFVIDEADRMLDMGFIPDIERIISLLPPRRQTLFFSATMPDEIKRLTKRFLRDPVQIEVARQSATADTITQRLIKTGAKPQEKRQTLRDQIDAAKDLTNAIVFCNRKRDVATVERSLSKHGYDARALHGDMDQRSRTETLNAFRAGELRLLIASDVAARGLDIPDVSHVFNFDVPTHAEDYVHRIGRTGRAGRTGTSITLVAPSDTKYLAAIEKLIDQKVGWMGAESTSQPAEKAVEDAPETTAKPKSRRRQRSKPTPSAADAQTDTQTDTAASAQKPDPQPQAEVRQREEQPKPPRRESKPKNRSPKPADPFGDDGPVPAFLLQSFAKS